jgi:hypothetical protein
MELGIPVATKTGTTNAQTGNQISSDPGAKSTGYRSPAARLERDPVRDADFLGTLHFESCGSPWLP